MASRIHPTAIVDHSAEIAEDVVIEAGALVGPRCRVGKGTRLRAHCHLVQDVDLGEQCDIHFGAVLGGDPQDLKYKGERTVLVVGDRNILREFCTVNRGTGVGGGITRIGDDNLIMAYVHIAHDCDIGNGCVITNTVQLAGHIRIDDMAILSGGVLVHHFVTIGTMAFIAAYAAVRADVPPYMIVDGTPARVRKLNVEGLRRRNIPAESVDALKRAHRKLYRSDVVIAEALKEIRTSELAQDPYVADLLASYQRSAAGVQGRALEALRADNGIKSATQILRVKEGQPIIPADAAADGARNPAPAAPTPEAAPETDASP